MTDIDPIDERALIDERDLKYIRREVDAGRREAALTAVSTYRRRECLHVGDAVPALELAQLASNDTINLGADRDRPLVLIFGSYT
ncbi:MAG: hypothetical protein ABGX07_16935 [Pirellulaceae bacterium]|jgi:hypothetical protein|nr:hypothetical protein [Planctomycetaceae bacterium]